MQLSCSVSTLAIWAQSWVIACENQRCKSVYPDVCTFRKEHICNALIVEDLMIIEITDFEANLNDWLQIYLEGNCPPMNANGPYWSSVSIGSGKCLVILDNKPLPATMLTQIYVVVPRWHIKAHFHAIWIFIPFQMMVIGICKISESMQKIDFFFCFDQKKSYQANIVTSSIPGRLGK